MASPISPKRRSVPHIVAPTFRSSRDAMLSTPSSELPYLHLPLSEHNQDAISGILYGAVDEIPSRVKANDDEDDFELESSMGRASFHEESSFRGSFMRTPLLNQKWNCLQRSASQIPAIALVTLFHLMVGIPFGVSYFPVSWKSSASTTAMSEGGDDVESTIDHGGFVLDGNFPLPGKEALGIRMFLFSTIVGQLVMTYASNFRNCIALQMVENVPFCQSLTYIVVEIQGYGKEALSTLFFLFGLASVIVGLVFYMLGRFNLGRILYFFPKHVLVGCIGGIGIFIAKTGLEVTANTSFSFSAQGWNAFIEKFYLLIAVFVFEFGLRIISHLTKDESGKSKYPLLAPIYFCGIPPFFYLCDGVLWLVSGKSLGKEFYFPPLTDDCVGNDCKSGITSLLGDDTWDMFRIIDLSSVSWAAVIRSIPTLIALVMFSLIHVPINIPAFAVSSNIDVDMNIELMAHGYSNGIAGMFGGLQNYMAYTQSMIYYKSGGFGTASSLAVAVFTTVLFLIGPAIASYLPRCMAGTLLLHCGVDLFMEGVYDSYGKYDYLEYAGIWAIVVVMSVGGMEAALVAGIICALLTFAIQSVAYPRPIRGSMTAATLRSSEWNRCPRAFEILDSEDSGRIRIFVVQFQGHLFFGNVSLFSDDLKELIRNVPIENRPYVIIVDLSLVLGIDSSAAQAIIKLRDSFASQFSIKLSIFVSGSADGFPCEINLSDVLTSQNLPCDEKHLIAQDGSSSDLRFVGSHVCDDLDRALIYAEDALIAMVEPSLLYSSIKQSLLSNAEKQVNSLEEEKAHAINLLLQKCSEEKQLVETFFSYFTREVYSKGDIVWRQGTKSDCAKLLVSGNLIASLENEAGTTEAISVGSVIGESGLVENCNRNSTVLVLEDSILYNLSCDSWDELKEKDPRCAHVLYGIVVRYLILRVQHCSNRIFETRCLPV